MSCHGENLDIADVGVGRARYEKTALRLKERIRVVILKARRGLGGDGFHFFHQRGRHQRARRVRRPVAAVRTGGQKKDIGRIRKNSMQLQSKRQRHFLIPSSFSFASKRDGCLAAGDYDGRFSLPGFSFIYGFGKLREALSRFGRLAGYRRAENLRVISQLLRSFPRRTAGQRIAAQDYMNAVAKDRVALFGRLGHFSPCPTNQTVHHRFRKSCFQFVLVNDRKGVLKCGGIGGGYAGCDSIDPVADHIRQNQVDQPGGVRDLGQASALDFRQMLSNAVDLVDAGAGRQQGLRGPALLVKADAVRGQAA